MATRTQTLRGRYASRILKAHVEAKYLHRTGRGLQGPEGSPLPSFGGIPPPSTFRSDTANLVQAKAGPDLGKVCIVGAGAAGIYMAWMLTYLGIEYDLFEASDRIGGRVFTYDQFKNDGVCPHNYYDVGAMRIPDIDSNKPTIDVMNCLNVQNAPYYLKNKTAPNYFDRMNLDADAVDEKLEPLDTAIKDFVAKINENFDDGFNYLIEKEYDKQSTREYLRSQGIDFDETQVLETFDTGTGLFDQSLTETVLDYADFPSGANWFRIEGGMIKLIDSMAAKIATPATLNNTVREYKMNGTNVDVTFTDQKGTRKAQTYSAVFNSTTLGALGRIELNNLGSVQQLSAIRCLAYDSATKVAIKFKTAWWVTEGGMDKLGGVSGTDLPIRVVAYPAWTDKDPLGQSTVLIASYTWHQDALRVGSLTPNQKTPPQDPNPEHYEVVKLVLQNLSTMFKTSHPQITYEFLLEQVIDWHTYAWQNDPIASGAFALFGPGQFTSLYPALFSPLENSNNSIFIIGEHASAHHAWISGALYSSATSLYGWLMGKGEVGQQYASKLKYPPPEDNVPFGGAIDTGDTLKDVGIPDEMEEDTVYWMAQLALYEPTDKRLRKLVKAA
ncbi:hypothetical protein BKA66DRAFT_595865 [Pyrenochaeta sp. MPI-SDFR-AT-0127]|nr:hypothetical protein BKA66DRAFT_595865 [Pyrenochaeta sp. MPI-SDFR-AT-0127]